MMVAKIHPSPRPVDPTRSVMPTAKGPKVTVRVRPMTGNANVTETTHVSETTSVAEMTHVSEMTHVTAAHVSEMTHVTAHVSKMSAAMTAAAMTAAAMTAAMAR
jgi:hypothetical protein